MMNFKVKVIMITILIRIKMNLLIIVLQSIHYLKQISITVLFVYSIQCIDCLHDPLTH